MYIYYAYYKTFDHPKSCAAEKLLQRQSLSAVFFCSFGISREPCTDIVVDAFRQAAHPPRSRRLSCLKHFEAQTIGIPRTQAARPTLVE